MKLPIERMTRIVWAWPVIALLAASPGARAQAEAAPFKPEEIEALVAPIALYPDSVLSQVLMASTYPLEVVYAARWLKANPNVKGDAAIKAVENQTWDVSVKSLVAFPQVLEPMDDKLDWTQKLGDAFLAQQKDVLDAVQRLRAKAQQSGNLKTTEQQKVIVEQARHRGSRADDRADRAGEPAGDLRADLRPGRGVRRLGLSGLSAVLLAALPGSYLLPRRRLRERHRMGHRLRRRRCHLRQLQLGRRRRQHRHQPGDQHRPQLRPQQGPGRRRWQHDASHRQGVAYRDNATREKFPRQRGGRRGAQRLRGRDGAGAGDVRRPAIAGLAATVAARATGPGGRPGQGGDRGGAGDRAGAGELGGRGVAVATMPSRGWAAAAPRSATSIVGGHSSARARRYLARGRRRGGGGGGGGRR